MRTQGLGEELGLHPLGRQPVIPTRLPAQLSCLANLASKHSLQGDFQTQPPNLLLFYK